MIDYNFENQNHTKLPITTSRKIRNLFISNNKLTSLNGSPNKVYGVFDCSDNKLHSLSGCPREIRKIFNISGNKISSLKDSPKIVETILGSGNLIESLEGLPEKCLYLTVFNNPLIDISDATSLAHLALSYNKKLAALPFVYIKHVNHDMPFCISKYVGKFSKEAVFSFQTYLLDNGYDDNAKWKPDIQT